MTGESTAQSRPAGRAAILVAYDVDTRSPEGRRRLRRVAKVCEAYGQRVQYSVFECTVSAIQYQQMWHRLVAIIEPSCDSLRVYRLTGQRSWYLTSIGRDKYVDFGGPLVF